jgi:hypothetical protein
MSIAVCSEVAGSVSGLGQHPGRYRIGEMGSDLHLVA